MSSSEEPKVDGYFITGTDTDVGKTRIALTLMRRLQEAGHCVVGMKPVASGAIMTEQGLRNPDALALQSASSIDVAYDWVNPYCYQPPIAPHIAAAEAGETIHVGVILTAYQQLVNAGATHIVVEGAGGWLVPINDQEMMSDIAAALNLPVIMVVAIRLGCLNHALLTAVHIDALASDFMGWIANHRDPAVAHAPANVAALTARLGEPLLCVAHSVS